MFKSKIFRKIAGSWLKVAIWFVALVAVVTIQSGAFRAQDAEASIEITATVNDPVVAKVQPSTGPTEGNVRVTISGTNFTNVIAVTFGGVNVPSFTTLSDSQISAMVPPGQPGAVKVVVITEDKAGALDNGFTYMTPATTTGVPSPTATTGPTTLAATPTGAGATALPPTTTSTGEELTTTPGGSVTPGQTTPPVTPETIPTTAPESAPVLSTTLATTTGAATITPTEAALTATSAPSLSPVVTPTVTPEGSLTPGPTATVAPSPTPEENSPTLANTPTVIPSISPSPFPTTADLVTLTPGPTAGLSPSATPATASPSTLAATVTVSPATTTVGPATVSATPELDATATASVAPTVTPELTATPTAIIAPTPTPASSPSPSPTVPVEGPPTITGVSPAQGTVEGGTTVIISGSNFAEDTEVTFGGLPPASVVVNSPTRITVVTAPQQAGTISIVVKNEGGLASLANGFTYVADTLEISRQPTNFNYSGKLNGKTLILKSSFKVGVRVTGTNPAGWRLVARSTVLSSGSVSIPATNHTIQNVQVVSNNGVAPANNLAYPLIFPVNSDTIFSAAPGTGTGETILTFETQLVIPPGIPAGSYKLSLNVDVVSGDIA